MASVVRPVGYTNSLQRLIWPQGTNIPVTAYLWGGGGGGGGNDSSSGGSGGGGGFSLANFTVSAGDVIDVAVGGGGGAGASGSGSAPGGSAGASFTADEVFNTRVNQPINYTDPGGNYYPAQPMYPVTCSAWCGFLNSTAAFVSPNSTYSWQNVYQLTIPTNGYYTINFSTDNYGSYYIPGLAQGFWQSFQSVKQQIVYATAGSYILYLTGVNYGGPGGIGMTISGGVSYSGGGGSAAGPSGSSGGGGGGGGATVLFLNGTEIAVAGGGGGGGGGGNVGAATGQSAPGGRGQATPGSNAGQNGQYKGGDGGGSGGGGGGWGGGNGGAEVGGDQGGYAGVFGLGYGNVTNPSGRNPGGNNNQYWASGTGIGGSPTRPGGSGYAVFEFNVGGTYVHYNGSFTQTNTTWVKANGVWSPVQATYVKNNGVWSPVNGAFAPTFESVSGNWGRNPRSFD